MCVPGNWMIQSLRIDFSRFQRFHFPTRTMKQRPTKLRQIQQFCWIKSNNHIVSSEEKNARWSVGTQLKRPFNFLFRSHVNWESVSFVKYWLLLFRCLLLCVENLKRQYSIVQTSFLCWMRVWEKKSTRYWRWKDISTGRAREFKPKINVNIFKCVEIAHMFSFRLTMITWSIWSILIRANESDTKWIGKKGDRCNDGAREGRKTDKMYSYDNWLRK